MKRIKQHSLIKYAVLLIVFLCFMTASILVFFYCVQKNVDKYTDDMIRTATKEQSSHFQAILESQYANLNGAAAYLGGSDSIESAEAQRLLAAVAEKNPFYRLMVITSDGMGYTSDGEEIDAAAKDYFIKSMQGEQTLSDSLKNQEDSAGLVMLSIPIWKDETIVGVLAGSYDIGAVSEKLFKEMYGGKGYSFIIDEEGLLVSIDSVKEEAVSEAGFFEYYGKLEFRDGGSIDTVKADLKNHNGNILKLGRDADYRYLSYQPLEYNGWMLCYVVPVSDAQSTYGFIRHYELVLSGVLALGVILLIIAVWRVNSGSQKSLIMKAQTDALTGLVNKEHTKDEIDMWLKSEACEGIQVLLMLDMDGFKEVNDTYGHIAGDEALREAASLLKNEFRKSDIIGRVGGDEFILLMKNVRSKSVVTKHMSDLCDKFRHLSVTGIKGQGIRCSVGIAYYPEHGTDFMSLYRCADEALYEVKENGRDGYHEYTGQKSENVL